MHTARLAMGGVALALMLGGSDALAQDDRVADSAMNAATVPPGDVTARAYLLHFRNQQSGGFGVGGLLTVRLNVVEAGGFAEAGSTLLDYSYNSLGGAAGLGLRDESGARLGAFATAGVHYYEGFDRGFLDDDPGASASTPFAGARLVASHRFGTPIDFGLLGSFETDLERQTVSYSYMSTPWLFGGDPTTKDETKQVGTATFGLGVQIGGTFDLS